MIKVQFCLNHEHLLRPLQGSITFIVLITVIMISVIFLLQAEAFLNSFLQMCLKSTVILDITKREEMETDKYTSLISVPMETHPNI